jgi:hypothetical protein
MPGLYAGANGLVAAFVGSVVAGAAARAFADVHLGRRVRPAAAVGQALSRMPGLVAIHLPSLALVAGFSHVVEVATAGRGVLIAGAAFLVLVGATLLIHTLFLYVTALYVIGRLGVRDTFATLPESWRAGFWAALLLSSLSMATWFMVRMLPVRAAGLVERGTPEAVVALMLAAIGASLLSGFLLCGSATLVYLTGLAPRLEQR